MLQNPLGQKTTYVSQYQRDLLFPILRSAKRIDIGIANSLPFYGYDYWNAYELSWLNPKGKPVIALAKFIFSAHSSHIIESKSLKLYLNSFNNTAFSSFDEVKNTLEKDLTNASGAPVLVELLTTADSFSVHALEGICLDDLDIACDTYAIHPSYLTTEKERVQEKVFSHLLKANCLITGQPDWGSIHIAYKGNKIQHEGLLKYIVSFRNHNEFAEPCVERIFMDIMTHCKPEQLSIHLYFTRRGGLDINPYRSTENISDIKKIRLARQ